LFGKTNGRHTEILLPSLVTGISVCISGVQFYVNVTTHGILKYLWHHVSFHCIGVQRTNFMLKWRIVSSVVMMSSQFSTRQPLTTWINFWFHF